MLSILQPEVTALESQVAALQAQIAAYTERIALLNDAEFIAGDSLESLRAAIHKVSSLAPSAVSNLRAAVLNLFTGNDGNDNDKGIEPQPAPQPGSDDGEEEAIAVELLTGQSTEWASPWACPLASPVACSLEIAAPLEADEPQQPYIELISVGHSVAYQRKASDGEIICCYLGGKSKARLQAWGESLCLGMGSGFELREAKRLTAHKWEIKIWGLSLDQIHRLAASDTTKAPTLDLTASHPVAEVESPLQGIDPEVNAALTDVLSNYLPDTEAHTFQIGNKVKITSDRHNTLNQLGLITAATSAGAAVNVGGVMRWFCSDELELVEAAPQRRKPIDDLFETSTATTTGYSMNPIGRAGAQKNWEILQAKRAMEREQKAAAIALDEPDF